LIKDWEEDHDEVRDSAKDWSDFSWRRIDEIPELRGS